MNNPANPKCNAEGYNDPTAFLWYTENRSGRIGNRTAGE